VLAVLIDNRPLFDTTADSRYAVERPAVGRELRESVERELNVVVHGSWGSGKTTTAARLVHDLREAGRAAALCQLAGDETVPEILVRVIERVAPGRAPEIDTGSTGARVVIELLRELGERTRSGLVVALDGIDPARGYELFGRLRDQVWRIDVTWVITVDSKDLPVLLAPPADVFFERVVEVLPFSITERRELLRKRLDGTLDPGAEASLVERGPENPRALLTLVREGMRPGRTTDRLLDGLAERERRAADLGRAHWGLVAEMEALGPVSASDEVLQTRLRLSRPRVAELMSDLEDAGLATSEFVRRGRGRPARVYTLVDPWTLGS